MYQKKNKDLLHYWNGIRGTRAAPKRIEISPAEISHILPQTFILEARNSQEFLFRLAGSKMCDIFGSEFRGLNFFSYWPIAEQIILKKYLSQLIDDGAVVSINFTATSDHNHEGSFEMIFMPLIHSGTHIDRILGGVAPTENYPWLGLTKLNFLAISTVELRIFSKASINLKENDQTSSLSFNTENRLVEGNHCQLRVFEGGKANQPTPRTPKL